MCIREYTPADLDALRKLHAAQGFGYPFPDVDSPLFVTKLVLEDGEDGSSSAASSPRFCSRGGEEACEKEEAHRDSPLKHLEHSARIRMAILLRLTAEAYLLHDPTAGTPSERWQHFLMLHEAAQQSAAARGLDDVQAFLPPRIARAFGRRLARLGWRQDPWPCFSRVTSV